MFHLDPAVIDKIATSMGQAYASRQDYSRYGNEPNLRQAIAEQIANGEANRVRHILALKGELEFAGRLNPESGQGGNTGLADKFLPNPGEWWVGVCADRTNIRVFFAGEQYLANAKPGNPWRDQCCVEVMAGTEPSRYNWAFGTIQNALHFGIVNPSGE